VARQRENNGRRRCGSSEGHADARSNLQLHENGCISHWRPPPKGTQTRLCNAYARLHALRDVARAATRRDLLITAAALAFPRGGTNRASVLLGVEREQLFARSPGTWVLSVHYRDQTRKALTREELDTCKTEARDLRLFGGGDELDLW
jgi:hypothetical protein